MRRSLLVAFIGWLFYCVLLRWGTFFPSVINHDESTYIVIGDALLQGGIYLDQVVDTKPAGLYWLYAAMNFLTAGKIWGLRLLTCCFIAATSLALFVAGRRATNSREVGIAAALAYPLMASIYTYYGVSPNAELFFNALTAIALALTIPRVVAGASLRMPSSIDETKTIQEAHFGPQQSYWLAGILLGLAVIIKPMAAADALAIGLFLLAWAWVKGVIWQGIFKVCLPLTLGFFLPIFGLLLYYYRLDMMEQLAFFNWEVTKRYPVDLAWYLRLRYLGDYALRYSPFVVLAILAWRQLPKAAQPWAYFLLLQLVIVSLVVIASGKRFGHYQIQLHPILAALAALWWLPIVSPPKWLPKIAFHRGMGYVFLLAAIIGNLHFFRYQSKEDTTRLIADQLRPRLMPTDDLFAINSQQLLYHLLDRPVPTRYVHPSLLFYDHHVEALEIDLQAEAGRIFSNPQLRYLVIRAKDLADSRYQANPILQAAKAGFPKREQLTQEYLLLTR